MNYCLYARKAFQTLLLLMSLYLARHLCPHMMLLIYCNTGSCSHTLHYLSVTFGSHTWYYESCDIGTTFSTATLAVPHNHDIWQSHIILYSIICLLRLLCILDCCVIRPKILVPIIFPYTSMLKHLCITDLVNSEFRPYLAVPNDWIIK